MTIPVLLGVFIAFAVAMIIIKSGHGKKTPKLDPFQVAQIESRGIQLLESLDIIATTKNIDTLESRITFINGFYSTFVVLSAFHQYLGEAEKALRKYNARYPKKTIRNSQVALLIKPNPSDLNDFFAACIVVCYGENVKEQALTMSKLTKEHAIKARKEKIKEVGFSAKSMFNTHNLPTDKGHLEAIDEMIKQF